MVGQTKVKDRVESHADHGEEAGLSRLLQSREEI